MTRLFFLAIVLWAAGAVPNGARHVHASSTSADDRELTDAVTAPMEDRELSFTLPGKVDQVMIKEGDLVKKDQILMKLDAKEQRAVVNRLKLQLVNNDLQIQAARKTLELYELEYKKNEELVEKGAGSEFELRRSKIQFELSEIELTIAEHTKKDTQLQLDRQEAIYDRYSLRAPIAGRVETVEVSEGETVQDQRRAVLLVVTDPLKIEAAVDIEHALHLKKGDKAWITSQLSGFSDVMEGTVTFTATVADPASETLRVTIKVPNTKGLKAGTSVTVSFDDPSRVASAD